MGKGQNGGLQRSFECRRNYRETTKRGLKSLAGTTGNNDGARFDQAAEFNDTVRAENDLPIGGGLDDLSGFLAQLVGVLQLPDKGVRIENVADSHRYLPGASVGLVRSAPSLTFNTSRA